jgi:hypothetical protein
MLLRRPLGRRLRDNRVPLGIGLLSMLVTMAYSLWEPLLLGQRAWLESYPNDLWAQWRAASLLLLHGGYTHVFTLDPVLKTIPGWEVLISPIARLFGGLPYPYPVSNPHPEAWLVVGPLFLLPTLLCTCAADCWLRRLEVGRTARVVVLAVVSLLVAPAILWGHPEDVMALGCGLYGLAAARDGRRSAGWWMGAALAFQIEAVLVLPLCLAVLPSGRWRSYTTRALVLPAAVLAVPLVGDPSTTVDTLVHQHVSAGGSRYTPTYHLLPGGAGSPIEVLIVVCASLVGVGVARRRDQIDDGTLLWLTGMVVSLRLFGPSLFPYYLVPGLVLLCLAAATRRPARLAATLVMGLALTGGLEVPLEGSWLRFIAVVVMMVLMAAVTRPRAAALDHADRAVRPPIGAEAEFSFP